jgi:tRNA nucleotidyltransferase (CCA-adding enzyme)
MSFLIIKLQYSSEAFSSVSDIVIVDPSGKLNIASAISKEEFQLVQMEARNTLSHLNNPKQDLFKEIFLENLCNNLLRFDHCFRYIRSYLYF